jgi:hypothetical protein
MSQLRVVLLHAPFDPVRSSCQAIRSSWYSTSWNVAGSRSAAARSRLRKSGRRSREAASRRIAQSSGTPLDAIQPVNLLRDDRWQGEHVLHENMTPQLLAAFRMLVDPRQERSRLLPTDRHRLSPSSLGR